jgi:predicted RNase H-like HicB family nuclease
MKLKVVIYPAEEGVFWAEVPAFAGCVSEGDTVEEILFNIQEAVKKHEKPHAKTLEPLTFPAQNDGYAVLHKKEWR